MNGCASTHDDRTRKWIKSALQLLALYADDADAGCLRKLSDVLTVAEWRKRALSDDTMKIFSLSGSPRFSHVLTTFGVPKDTLARFLSVAPYSVNADLPTSSAATTTDDECSSSEERLVPSSPPVARALSFPPLHCTTKVAARASHVETLDERWLVEQSDSVHFATCLKKDVNKRNMEMVYFKLGLLFFWTVGQPMSVDGRGFEARAKLRVMFDQPYPYLACSRRNSESTSNKFSYTLPRRAWLYIERPYGHTSRLFENAHELVEWWTVYAVTRGWDPQAVIMKIPQDYAHLTKPTKTTTLSANMTLYCPSAAVGHQDTLGEGNVTIITQENQFCEVHSGDYLLLFLLSYSKTSWIPTRTTLDQLLAARAKSGQVAGVESLLFWGANPNMPSNEPPLVSAVVGGFSDIVKLLLDYGASTTSRSFPGGETPLYIATLNNQKPVDDSLFEDFLGARTERNRVMELLLTAGAQPNSRTDEGASPLEAAVVLDDLDAASLLLSYGAEFHNVCSKRSSIYSTLLELASPSMSELLSSQISGCPDLPADPSSTVSLVISSSPTTPRKKIPKVAKKGRFRASSGSSSSSASAQKKKTKKKRSIVKKITVLFKRKNHISSG